MSRSTPVFLLSALLLGLVSLTADILYEGYRSIIGAYLTDLGVSVPLVGLAYGISEFLNYFLRLFTGYLCTVLGSLLIPYALGYLLTAVAVPLSGLVPSSTVVITLMILERVGKAVRTPARDSLVAQVAPRGRRGLAFGILEVLDQFGAVVGPGTLTLLLTRYTYAEALTSLWVVSLILVLILILTLHYLRGRAGTVTRVVKPSEVLSHLPHLVLKTVPLYLMVLGLYSYVILASLLASLAKVPPHLIPLIYLVAMLTDGLTALPLGHLYDRYGTRILYTVPLLTLTLPVLVLTNQYLVYGVLYGVVLSFHETVFRAYVAETCRELPRPVVFGVYGTLYGAALLLTNTIIAYLTTTSSLLLILYVSTTQLLALLLLHYTRHH